VTELERVRAHSQAGRIMERILDLEFTLDHLSVRWDEVTAEEVKGIQILKDERESYKRELAKRPPDHAFPS
jgi:hypothetical protein